jgi:hypothetical protein
VTAQTTRTARNQRSYSETVPVFFNLRGPKNTVSLPFNPAPPEAPLLRDHVLFWRKSRGCWFESEFKAEVCGSDFKAINAGGLIALLVGFGSFIHVGVPPTEEAINQDA